MEKKSGGKTVALLSGLGVGAALMYVLDPERGRRRRALARDKAVSFANKTGDAVSRRSRDLANRAKGLAAEARSAFEREETDGAEGDSLSGGTKGYGSSPEARSASGEGEGGREPRQMAGDDKPRIEEEGEL